MSLEIIEDSGKNINLLDGWKKIHKEIYSLLKIKNSDYGDTWQKFGSAGAFISLSKRFYRIKNILLNKTEINNESIEDSLKDLINEATFLILLLREEKKNGY